MRRVFNSLDVDHVGAIHRSQMGACLLALGASLTPEAVEVQVIVIGGRAAATGTGQLGSGIAGFFLFSEPCRGQHGG